MTVPFDAGNPGDGALGLYSAVGDALADHRAGFGLRRAAVAAAFARTRGATGDGIDANWYAGLLADIGRTEVVIAPDATEHTRTLLLADAPLYGARIVAALPGLPAHAADVIRWHREHEDGTGFPDRLRWDGIPPDAAALGIVHAFLEACEDPEEPREPGEALFTIMAQNGRRFRVELVRAFRDAMQQPGWDEAAPPAARPDDPALLPRLSALLDGRSQRTSGRSARTAALAGMLAERLGGDRARAERLAHLLALGNATAHHEDGDFDPLSRFARDRRVAAAKRAADVARGVPAFRSEATVLALCGDWHAGAAGDALAPVVGLAAAVDGLDPLDAPRLVAAASGSQFDPAVVRVYLAALGAPT